MWGVWVHVGPALQGPSGAGHTGEGWRICSVRPQPCHRPHILPHHLTGVGVTWGPLPTPWPGPASASDSCHWHPWHPRLIWAPQRWSRDCNSWVSSQKPRTVTTCFDRPEHICKLQIPQLIFTYQAQKEASGKQTKEAT